MNWRTKVAGFLLVLLFVFGVNDLSGLPGASEQESSQYASQTLALSSLNGTCVASGGGCDI